MRWGGSCNGANQSVPRRPAAARLALSGGPEAGQVPRRIGFFSSCRQLMGQVLRDKLFFGVGFGPSASGKSDQLEDPVWQALHSHWSGPAHPAPRSAVILGPHLQDSGSRRVCSHGQAPLSFILLVPSQFDTRTRTFLVFEQHLPPLAYALPARPCVVNRRAHRGRFLPVMARCPPTA